MKGPRNKLSQTPLLAGRGGAPNILLPYPYPVLDQNGQPWEQPSTSEAGKHGKAQVESLTSTPAETSLEVPLLTSQMPCVFSAKEANYLKEKNTHLKRANLIL